MTGADRQFRVVTYNSSTDKHPNPQILALEELYALLAHDEVDCVLEDGTPGCRGKKCPNKDGLAWSPGFIPEGQTRKKENVESLDLAVFDIDHINQAQLEALCVALEGVELYLHTTHNHLPPNDQSFRLVLPFARAITPDEWKQIWFSIVRKFNLPQVEGHGVDKATRDPCRLSYFPRALRGRPFVNEHQEGKLLDPKELLLENSQFSRTNKQTAPRPDERPEGSVDPAELKGFLRRYDPQDDNAEEKKENIRRVLDEEPLCAKGTRGFTTYRLGSIVGSLLPLYTPLEAALELVRPAISKIEILKGDDPAESSFEAWMSQVQRGFEGAQEEKETKAIARNDASGKLIAISKRKRQTADVQKMIARLPPFPNARALSPPPPMLASEPARTQMRALSLVPPPVHFPIPPEPPTDRDDEGDWRIEKMIQTVDKQGRPHPKNTFANVIVVLENHRAWKGVLRYNELTNEPEAYGGPLPEAKRGAKRLITGVRTWLAHQEELEMPNFEVVTAVEDISLNHRYDPIKEYLTNLVWDGVPRIHNWLSTYCGARQVDDRGVDVSMYVRMVGKKWLMAGAARALYPGCKADNVLVFEGEQYKGKSKALGILGGKWFADTKLNLSDKSTLEMTSKNWIIELSELASMRKGETESQKSFFSTSADSFRLSYAPRVEKFPRRCILAGTTNEVRYLFDLTGNRRFWCIWCDWFDMVALKRDRDQLWAEAAALVRAGETCPNCLGVDERCSEHRWWLDAGQTEYAESIATTRLKGDFTDEVLAWWYSKEPEKRPESLTIKDILVTVLGMTLERKEQYQTAIGRTMKVLGFTRAQPRTTDGTRERIYLPSHHLRTHPKEKSASVTSPAQDLAERANTKRLGPPEPTQLAPGEKQ